MGYSPCLRQGTALHNDEYPVSSFRRRSEILLKVRPSRFCALLAVLPLIAGCEANPVTGEKELVLFSTEHEIETGQRNYGPLQQASGGRYRVDPKLEEYVASVGHRVARVSDRPLPYEFVLLNSSVPNAWALPGGKIAVNRGLLTELENEAELAAVLGHEVVHAAARHGAGVMNRNLILGTVAFGVALASADSKHAGHIAAGTGLASALIDRGYSRADERTADRYGMKYMHAAGYDTGAAVTLQEKFVALSEGREPGWLAGWFATHPPSSERVNLNRDALADFPPGGELGGDRYRSRLAYLRARKPAYDSADRAAELLDTRPQEALRLLEEAIGREPREALFHGLKGQALARQGRYRDAVDAYDAAIRRDARYYQHYLGRGLARDALRERAGARSDLEQSNRLLPTHLANYTLGRIAMAGGNRADAKRFFRSAKSAGGSLGEAATRDFTMLDIADNPARYILLNPVFANNQVLVDVENPTDYPLRTVTVEVAIEFNKRPSAVRFEPFDLDARSSVTLESGVHYRPEDSLKANARLVRAGFTPPSAHWANIFRAYP